jgi:spore maturation protein CgeB
MRILIGHVYSEYSNNSPEMIAGWIGRLRSHGFDVDSICLLPNVSSPVLYWPELEKQWKIGNKSLLRMYESLAKKLEDFDVFLNFNGINLHPDFVQQLSTFNVYACFDDPESSERLSKPVAWAYDLAMVGNIAEVEKYKQWGVKKAMFWPLGFRNNDFDPTLTKEQILSSERETNVALLCEHVTEWRIERLDRYAAAFPGGAYFGLGWPNGSLPETKRIPLLLRTKIGINIHNSSGPVNFRTYYLPANGVLEICDNKSFLGQIFELNKEVIGFDKIEEAIELTKYYLAHEQERRQIAADGWERAMKDYNEIAVFKRLVEAVANSMVPKERSRSEAVIYVRTHGNHSFVARTLNAGMVIYNLIKIKISQGLNTVYRRI